MSRIWLLLAITALALPGAADAARKTTRKPPSKSKIVIPKAVAEPVAKPSYMVPNAVKLRPMTPVEAQANAVWSLRSALNIAALQCQFSPYLATVATYNDFLKSHSEELSASMLIMQAYFRRLDGTRGMNSFDQYVTQTYQSYSTMDAQYSFCEQAALIGREALTLGKGALGPMALRSYAIMRGALVPKPLSPTLVFVGIDPITLPDLAME